jgi:hypothetical protein
MYVAIKPIPEDRIKKENQRKSPVSEVPVPPVKYGDIRQHYDHGTTNY